MTRRKAAMRKSTRQSSRTTKRQLDPTMREYVMSLHTLGCTSLTLTRTKMPPLPRRPVVPLPLQKPERVASCQRRRAWTRLTMRTRNEHRKCPNALNVRLPPVCDWHLLHGPVRKAMGYRTSRNGIGIREYKWTQYDTLSGHIPLSPTRPRDTSRGIANRSSVTV